MPYIYTKKYAILGKTDFDVTVKVRLIMKEQRVTQRKLGKLVGWHHTTINAMLKRRTWNIAELLAVGKALNHDLLQYYYPTPPEPQVAVSKYEAALKQAEELKDTIRVKDEELLKLRTENNVLREVFGKNG